jgi:hypothetical protein
MNKIWTSTLTAGYVALLGAAGVVAAQSSIQSTEMRDANGQVIVRWGQNDRAPDGPKPSFEQLDTDGNGSIDEGEATVYRLLADDYIHADGNRDGRVSRREFDRW